MKIETKYSELKNFLSSFFGDYWEGKSEKDIIEVASKENTKEYLSSIQQKIEEFIIDEDYTLMEKGQFVRSTNVYFKKEEEALVWLKLIKDLIQEVTI